MANHPQTQTVGQGADITKTVVAVLLVLAGFGAYFYLAGLGMSGWLCWIALLVALVCAGSVFMLSSWGKEFFAYCKDSVREVKKVVWPTRKEAGQQTLLVFGFVFIMSLLLWLIDMMLQWGIAGKILGWS